MKLFISLLFSALILSVSSQAQSELWGAWERQGNEDAHHVVLILTDGYWSFTEYSVDQKNFVGTMGGSWSLEDGKINYNYEFSTFAEVLQHQLLPSAVSQDNNNELTLGNTKWNRIDDGTPGALNGAWLITGRERSGSMNTITPGSRKTMKILSGTRFQWIAYNTETREFMGTGGGTYTTEDGRYTENIEFFSRDNSRVGASLGFEFQLQDGQWHHRGKSSKGNPIYEIWSPRPL